jgi:hypothetical protein
MFLPLSQTSGVYALKIRKCACVLYKKNHKVVPTEYKNMLFKYPVCLRNTHTELLFLVSLAGFILPRGVLCCFLPITFLSLICQDDFVC